MELLTRSAFVGLILALGFGPTGIGLGAEQPEPADGPELTDRSVRITVRNASYPLQDPGGDRLATHFELREREIEIPVDQMALVLIDTWNVERERFGAGERLDVAAEIRPLLDLARELDLVVLHAPHRWIGWDGLNRRQSGEDFRGPSSMSRDRVPESPQAERFAEQEWPPVEFVFRVGEYGQYSTNSNPAYLPYPRILGLHPDLLPKKRDREFIVSRIDKIQEIFREHGILHLLYVGGATNKCIVNRPVGIRNMAAKGYNTLIVRGATVGSELESTYEVRRVTEAAILDIEINHGFSVDRDHLLEALAGLR